MTGIDHGEVFAWGLIVAALVFAALRERQPRWAGGAVVAAALAALLAKSTLLSLG